MCWKNWFHPIKFKGADTLSTPTPTHNGVLSVMQKVYLILLFYSYFAMQVNTWTTQAKFAEEKTSDYRLAYSLITPAVILQPYWKNIALHAIITLLHAKCLLHVTIA